MKHPQLSLETKYDYYELSVQNANVEVEFMRKWYKKWRGHQARVLREDFCGTGLISCEWVKSSKENKAISIDLDAEPIGLGKMRNWSMLSKNEQSRMRYLQDNVLTPKRFKVDVICAFNFSYFIFKERKQLLDYFRVCRRGLEKDGVLYLDLFGGPDSQTVVTDKRKVGSITYYWECQEFNPLNHHCRFAIHFKERSGIFHRNTFTYDWRMWTLPELKDILFEAGFGQVIPFWEGEDDSGGGDGNFVPQDVAENCPAWVSYIAALV